MQFTNTLEYLSLSTNLQLHLHRNYFLSSFKDFDNNIYTGSYPFFGEATIQYTSSTLVILLFAITAFTATRSSTHGSFFIRILVATFYRHANHKDVEELFKIVSHRHEVVYLKCLQ